MPEAIVAKGHGSLRSAGLRNVVISAATAVSTYVSLMLVARRFGGSLGSDAYFFLLSLTTISTSVIGSIFATVFLPILVNLRVRDGDHAASEFAGTLLVCLLAFVLPVASAIHLLYVPFFRGVSRFDAVQLIALRPVLLNFSLIFALSVVAEYFRVIALALGRYSLAAVGALFQPLMLIVVLQAAGQAGSEQVMAFALLVSKLALLVLMLWVVLGVQRFAVPLRFSRNTATGHFVRISTPYWSANIVTNLATFYFDYVATGLGTGVISAIAYAQRIFALPIAVVLTPILEIARTQFAEAQAHHDVPRLAHRHNQLLRLILYFSIPVATVMACIPHLIVSTMFQRGAFGEDSVQIAAQCLRVFALSIPLTATFMLNGRAVESFQRLAWPSAIGTLGNALMIGVTTALVQRFGYIGIPAARFAVELCFFLPFGFVALQLFAGRVERTGAARALGNAGIAAVVPAVACFGAGLQGRLSQSLPQPVVAAMIVLLYFALYGTIVAMLERRALFEDRAVFGR